LIYRKKGREEKRIKQEKQIGHIPSIMDEVQVPLWSKHKVVEWLQTVNPSFHKYGHNFLQSEINGEVR